MKLDSCSGNCVITGLGPSISTISGSIWIGVPDPKLAEVYIAECSVDGSLFNAPWAPRPKCNFFLHLGPVAHWMGDRHPVAH